MKRNFGLGNQFYWSLPREIRREIKTEEDAGFAIYHYMQVQSRSGFRKTVRQQGYKNIADFMRKMMPKKKEN